MKFTADAIDMTVSSDSSSSVDGVVQRSILRSRSGSSHSSSVTNDVEEEQFQQALLQSLVDDGDKKPAAKPDDNEDIDEDDIDDEFADMPNLVSKGVLRPSTADSSGTAKSFDSAISRIGTAISSAAVKLNCSKLKSKRHTERPSTAEAKRESGAANLTTKKVRHEMEDGPDASDVQQFLAQLSFVDGCDDRDDVADVNENEAINLVDDSDDDAYEFDDTRATIPRPNRTTQKALYQTFEQKLRAANRLYSDEKGVGRGPIVNDLLQSFHPRNLEDGDLLALGQGKCAVPEGKRGGINFEGRTAPDNDRVFNKNASIKGASSIAHALPPNGTGDREVFQYTTKNRLRLMGLNCRLGCKSTRNASGQEHCDEPDEVEVKVTVMIASATIEYLTAMGCFVMYLNFGGTAVKKVMVNVKRNLSDLPETQRRHVLVVESSTHMYRLSYCVGNPMRQAESVTDHMTNMSEKVDKFMDVVVNPIRCNEGKERINWAEGNMLRTLLADNEAVYVASNSDQASMDNLIKKSHEQAVARGVASAASLKGKYGEEWFVHLGKCSMAFGAEKNGVSVKEYAAMIGERGGRRGALLEGLKLMNIDVDSIMNGVNNDGQSLEEQVKAAGIDVNEAKSKWGKAINEKRKEKYTAAENSERARKAHTKVFQAAGLTLSEGMNKLRALATTQDKQRGASIGIRKRLLKNDGGALYRFKCITCKTDCYVGRKGNDWGSKRQTTCETCRMGQKNLPNPGTTKNMYFTFEGEITGAERANIRKEWENEIEAYEAEKKLKKKNKKEKKKNAKKKNKK